LRCTDCERNKLDAALHLTEAGELISRVLKIEAALEMKFNLRLDDITAEEFACLHALWGERGKLRQEEIERQEREAKRGT
jgi:hypothetical protein